MYTNWAPDQPNNPGGRDDNALLMNGALARSSGGVDAVFSIILLCICKIILPVALVAYVFFALQSKSAARAQAVCILLTVLTFLLTLDAIFGALVFFDNHVVKEV